MKTLNWDDIKDNLKHLDSTVDLDFNKMHNECRIDLEQVYERPPLAISIGRCSQGYHNPFGTFGNISLIKGEES